MDPPPCIVFDPNSLVVDCGLTCPRRRDPDLVIYSLSKTRVSIGWTLEASDDPLRSWLLRPIGIETHV